MKPEAPKQSGKERERRSLSIFLPIYTAGFYSIMFLKRNTCLLVVLFCSLTLWVKSTSAGSSYLSPSQKPQIKGKSSRGGRQAMEEPRQPTEDNHITISAPFEIGFTMREEDFEEYGVVLQEIIQRLLGNTEPAAEKPSPF